MMLRPEPPKREISAIVQERVAAGWTIASDGPSGVHLLAPRKMRFLDKCALVVAGGLVIVVWPLSVIIAAMVAIDFYFLTPRAKEFLPRGP